MILVSFREMRLFNDNYLEMIHNQLLKLMDLRELPFKLALLEREWELLLCFAHAILYDLDFDGLRQLIGRNHMVVNLHYGLVLILDCKDASLFESKESWQRVSGELLTPTTRP